MRYLKKTHPNSDDVPRPLISSVRVESTPAHDVVLVWNRGGLAGTLKVNKGDGEMVANRLLQEGTWVTYDG